MARHKGSKNKVKPDSLLVINPIRSESVEEIRKINRESLQLIFCGSVSVLLLYFLAKLPFPLFKSLEQDVGFHITALPISLVLLGLISTALVTLLFGARIDVFVRETVAKPITTLATHLTSLWFGALLAKCVITPFAGGDWEAMGNAFCSVVTNFTLVAAMQLASVVTTGAIDREMKTRLASFVVTAISLVALWIFISQLLAHDIVGHSAFRIECTETSFFIGSIAILTWAIVQVGAKMGQSVTSSIVKPITTADRDAVKTRLSNSQAIVQSIFSNPFAKKNPHISLDVKSANAWQVRASNAKVLGHLENQPAKLGSSDWVFTNAGGDYKLRVMLRLSELDRSGMCGLSVEAIGVYPTSFWRRFWQSVNCPSGEAANYFATNFIKHVDIAMEDPSTEKSTQAGSDKSVSGDFLMNMTESHIAKTQK